MNCIGNIEKAELYVVKIPLVSPFVTGSGVLEHRESLLLKLSSGGFSGWGECAAFRDPWYHPETIDTSLHIAVSYLLPLLMRTNDFKPEIIQEVYSWIKGHHMAKAMVENAVTDLFSRVNKMPLYEFLKGKRKKIMSGISIGITKDIESLLGQVDEAVKRKYHRVKLKIKKGWDVNVISAIRSSFPALNLTVDANGNYTYEDLAQLKLLDEFELKMIEQPLHPESLIEHAALRKQIRTPICLDESIGTAYSAINAVNLESCDVVCIKQARVGGLKNAIQIKDYCLENRVQIWCGGMLDTGIGRAFNLHLQTVAGFGFPGDTSATSRYFNDDIVVEPVVLDDEGYIEVPPGDGIGVEIDEARVDNFMIFRKKMV